MINKYVYILLGLLVSIFCNVVIAKPITAYGLGMNREKALDNALKNAVEIHCSRIIHPQRFTKIYRKIDSLFIRNYRQYIENPVITDSTKEFNLLKVWVTCNILQEKLIDSLIVKNLMPKIKTRPKYAVIFEKNSSLTPSLKKYTLRKFEEICLKNGYKLIDMEQLKELISLRRSDTLVYPNIEHAAFVYGIDFLIKVNVYLSDVGEKKIYGKEFYSISGETSINIVRCDNAEIISSHSGSKKIESRDKVSLSQRVIAENINSITNLMVENVNSFWFDELYQSKEIELVVKNSNIPLITYLENRLKKNSNIINWNLRYMERDITIFDLKILGTMQDLRAYLISENENKFSLHAINANQIIIQPGKNNSPAITQQEKSFLEINAFKIDTIYASLVDYYASHKSAHISLQCNGGNISDVKVSVSIPGIMKAPSEVKISILHEKQDVSLCLVLDRGLLQNINNSKFAMSRVDISYSIDGQKEIKTLTAPVMIHNKNSINWKNPLSVASFVDNNDKSIRTVSRELSKAVLDSTILIPVSIRNAVAIFEYLRLRGSKYVSDPLPGGLKRVDKIKYPVQTLSDLSGDCDDFSVLYAAMLSSIGINTAIVIYQDHVNVLFDTGIEVNRFEKICLEKSDIIIHENGNIWIPIEVTKFEEGFLSSWKTASKKYNKALQFCENLEIIDVLKAWETYPPASFHFKSESFKKSLTLKESTLKEIKKMADIPNTEIINKIDQFKNKNALTHQDLNNVALQYMKKNDPGNARIYLKKIDSDDIKIEIENNIACTHVLAGEFSNAENIFNKYYMKDSTGAIAINRVLLHYIKYITGISDLQSLKHIYEEALSINPFAIGILESLEKSYSQVNVDSDTIQSQKKLKTGNKFSFPLSFQLVDSKQPQSKELLNNFPQTTGKIDNRNPQYFAATSSETSTGSLGGKGFLKSSNYDKNSLHIYELLFWFKF